MTGQIMVGDKAYSELTNAEKETITAGHFDVDGSGALDAAEAGQLYAVQNLMTQDGLTMKQGAEPLDNVIWMYGDAYVDLSTGTAATGADGKITLADLWAASGSAPSVASIEKLTTHLTQKDLLRKTTAAATRFRDDIAAGRDPITTGSLQDVVSILGEVLKALQAATASKRGASREVRDANFDDYIGKLMEAAGQLKLAAEESGLAGTSSADGNFWSGIGAAIAAGVVILLAVAVEIVLVAGDVCSFGTATPIVVPIMLLVAGLTATLVGGIITGDHEKDATAHQERASTIQALVQEIQAFGSQLQRVFENENQNQNEDSERLSELRRMVSELLAAIKQAGEMQA